MVIEVSNRDLEEEEKNVDLGISTLRYLRITAKSLVSRITIAETPTNCIRTSSVSLVIVVILS
jgi:hypothetical protein